MSPRRHRRRALPSWAWWQTWLLGGMLATLAMIVALRPQ
ncbi:hypothetical protein M2168_001282 [Streptomyces sp. CZ24]|nr:hypothetical protein [Streptomyces sp. CZ24]